MLTVVKEFSFDYAHWLPDYEGKCRELHGHTARLRVEVSGPPLGVSQDRVYPGMVVDFSDLSRIVKERVVEKLDHSCLNHNQEFRDFSVYPTCERMVMWIVEQLKPVFGGSLVSVELWETPTSFARWQKDG